MRIVARVALFGWVCVGCAPGGPSIAADAALDAAALDAPARPPRTYDGGVTTYHQCTSAAECPDGVVCNADFPRGACTPRCTTDADCPEAGACRVGVCYASCTSGGAWCRDDEVCIDGACFASCTARTDMPELACRVGACLSNFCTSAAPGPGADGAPCTSYHECASLHCLVEASGWPRGMCVRVVRMPGVEAFAAPGPMPSDRCPDALAVGVAQFDRVTEGEGAYCLPRCVVDDDCRDGYRCERHGSWGAPVHDDGVCVPWPCGPSFPDCVSPRVCFPYGTHSATACGRTTPP